LNENECAKKEKNKLMGISRQPVKIMTNKKHPEDVEYFKYLYSTMINDARNLCGVELRISLGKRCIQQKKRLFSPSKWT
jgi:hypothetical protein